MTNNICTECLTERVEGYDAWAQLRQSNSGLNELYDPKNFASGAIFMNWQDYLL